MKYEIINPSDQVFIESDDELLACVAVMLLGSGRYGLERETGERAMPIFLFGGHEKWLAERGIADLTEYGKANYLRLAAVYDSAFYGSLTEMRALEGALALLPEADRPEARASYNDRRRSSMNDIGRSCAALAKRCRELASEVRS